MTLSSALRNFYMAMEVGRCLIRSTVRLEHVEKCNFLMAWSKFLRTGLNSLVWYHSDSSGFLPSSR